MSITRPATIQNAWASTASGGYINTVPQTGSGVGGVANWQLGFPPTVFGVGAIPFSGADLNGAMNVMAANIQWENAGMAPVYDSALSTAIGGYPKGAVLCLSDGFTFVISTANANTNNPNLGILGSTNWAPFGGTLAGASNATTDFGSSANARVVATNPPQTMNVPGTSVIVNSVFTNTGACTLNAGGGALPLLNNQGGALVAGDLPYGAQFHAVIPFGGGAWVLLAPVPSQYNATALSLFGTQHSVVGSRVTGTGYANATGKPMFVSVTASMGAGNNTITLVVGGVTIQSYSTNSANTSSVSGIVPIGATYSVAIVGSVSPNAWVETY
jgi:hypothetical protein